MAQHSFEQGFTDSQFRDMQQEAIKRVMEMQKRSNNIISSHNSRGNSRNTQTNRQNPPPPPPDTTPPARQPENNDQQNDLSALLSGLLSPKSQNKILNNLLDEFKPDEEKIILGILIYILAKNGADLKLILSLAYLII